jgi:hypothetical protein
MNADTAISIEEFHTRIVDAIKAQFPDLQTVEFYREDRDEVPTPACLLDMPWHRPDSRPLPLRS